MRITRYRAKHHEIMVKDPIGEYVRLDDIHALASLVPQSLEGLREKLIEVLTSELSCSYACTRVWSAWDIGTMSVDDFYCLSESDRLNEIADEILATISGHAGESKVPQSVEEFIAENEYWGDTENKHNSCLVLEVDAVHELMAGKALVPVEALKEKPLPELMMASYHEAIGWNNCIAAIKAAKGE